MDEAARYEKPSRLVDSERIACNLLADEAVEGQVRVEGADHVVAIRPGVLAVEVGLGAIGFGPADDIQPELRPALAEVRRGQQLVHAFFIGVRIGVAVERLDLLRRRRKSRQRDGGATQ